jgi:endonuclease/exonuclease/phosphatase family metal-dependent hydrolase
LFSRDCPLFDLRLASGAELVLLVNHLKSQSFSSGDPDPLRSRQSTEVRAIYDQVRADGAEYVAVLGDFNKGPDRADPTSHPTLEPLLGPDSPLVDAYGLPDFDVGNRPGSFQSCSITNRLDYLLMSPELAAKVTGGGVFRKGLWGNPRNQQPPRPEAWTVYPEITAAEQAASDHAAVWVDIDV